MEMDNSSAELGGICSIDHYKLPNAEVHGRKNPIGGSVETCGKRPVVKEERTEHVGHHGQHNAGTNLVALSFGELL